jgi:hypothetical protein
MKDCRQKLCLFAAFLASFAFGFGALGDPVLLVDSAAPGAFPLVTESAAAALFVAQADWPGVIRAASDLQADVERVSGRRPEIKTDGPSPAPVAVIIGTVGRSPLIDGLVAAGKLDVAAIQGKWEGFILQTIEQPLPGVDRALVIAGSDKRGTIYGVYEISQQIGVSPWRDGTLGPLSRHFPERRGAGPHQLGTREIRQRHARGQPECHSQCGELRSRILHAPLRADVAGARQLPLASDVE